MTIFPSGFRPMKGEPLSFELGGKKSLDRLDWSKTYFYQDKFDGIRCLTQQVQLPAYSSRLLPLPNRFLQSELSKLPAGLDGELMVQGAQGQWLSCNDCNSAFSSQRGEPNFFFLVFDLWCYPNLPYEQRLLTIHSQIDSWRAAQPRVVAVPGVRVADPTHALQLEQGSVDRGFEGGILRQAGAGYKYGRSTFNEAYFLKLKRYVDAEGTVEGCFELRRNDNEPTLNELGLTKRSSSELGRRGVGTLGGLFVRSHLFKEQFSVGGGFTQRQREEFWSRRDELVGQQITFKYQAIGSTKERPRQPVFKCFRNKLF